MKFHHAFLAMAVLLSGCADIKNTARVSQKVDKSLVAGIGDTVIEVETRESLPNVFGKASIFGRTRPTGKVFVIYLGVEQGRAVFERTTIRLQSNATTMNST